MSNDSLASVQRIIAECLMIPADSIQAADPIQSLKNIDSLSFEMIIVRMEVDSGKSIDPAALFALKSVADLAQLFESLQAPHG